MERGVRLRSLGTMWLPLASTVLTMAPYLAPDRVARESPELALGMVAARATYDITVLEDFCRRVFEGAEAEVGVPMLLELAVHLERRVDEVWEPHLGYVNADEADLIFVLDYRGITQWINTFYRDGAAVGPLVDALEHHGEWMVRYAAARELGKGHGDVLEPLLHAFRHDPHPAVRDRCAWALSVRGYDERDPELAAELAAFDERREEQEGAPYSVDSARYDAFAAPDDVRLRYLQIAHAAALEGQPDELSRWLFIAGFLEAVTFVEEGIERPPGRSEEAYLDGFRRGTRHVHGSGATEER